jgi:hypothetical protein
VNQTNEGLELGWLPDYPDLRDFTPKRAEPPEGEARAVPALLQEVGAAEPQESEALRSSIDLRQHSPVVEDQGSLGSCTANAAAGIIEYFEHRAFGRYTDASRLFLYKTTRNLMGMTGDTGAFLRTTMQAMVLFGAPPESIWPCDIDTFDTEPSAFCYSFTKEYKALPVLPAGPSGVDPGGPAQPSEDQPRGGTSLHVRLHDLFVLPPSRR